MPALVAVASAGPRAAIKSTGNASYFVGNFNRCGFSQWNLQGPQRAFKIVRRPKVEGRCAAAITVGAWAINGMVNPEADGADLNLVPAPYGTNGNTVWQHFSVRFGHGYRATPGEWNFGVQWHDDKGWQKFKEISFEYANLCWMIRTTRRGVPRVGMRVMGGLSTAPQIVRVNGPKLKTEHWYNFLVKTVWSPDARKGYVEWWLDGALLYARHVPTLYTRPDGSLSIVYFSELNYRRHASWETTIYFDGTRLGPTRASVRY
jgi:hypothetical protein